MKHRIKAPVLFAARVFQGAVIGGGAILPGISGGVLAATFGVYRPMMEVLAHPRSGLKKHFRRLLPIGIGWVAGFIVLARLLKLFFGAYETAASCLFIGLIAGELPTLLDEAGASSGKGTRRDLVAFVLSLFIMLSLFRFFEGIGADENVAVGFWTFALCGAAWGLSLIVPGFATTSVLIYLGLYEPIMAGFSSLKLAVLAPFFGAFAVVVVALARLVNHIYQRYASTMSHVIAGFVVASSAAIIPTAYASAGAAALCAALFAGGFVAARLTEKYLNFDAQDGEAAHNT